MQAEMEDALQRDGRRARDRGAPQGGVQDHFVQSGSGARCRSLTRAALKELGFNETDDVVFCDCNLGPRQPSAAHQGEEAQGIGDEEKGPEGEEASFEVSESTLYIPVP